jgi:hypothetical protein
MPHPRTIAGINIRWGTLTMRMEEKGCHASCAIGAIEPTREYWLPLRPVSFCRPKIEPYPRTDLSRIWGERRVSLRQWRGIGSAYELTCRKYTQTRMTRITESVLRRILLLYVVGKVSKEAPTGGTGRGDKHLPR